MDNSIKSTIKEWSGIGVLIIFYSVGLIGSTLFDEDMMRLTPLNLLLSLIIMIAYHPVKNNRFWIYSTIVFVAGFLIEWAGVSTGKIFGHYYYGNNLGFKLFDIPVIIGINWLILSYSSMSVIKQVSIKTNFKLSGFSSSLLGAVLMVLADFWIEQLCARLDFWYWQTDTPPVQNYVAWFVCAFMFNSLLHFLKIEPKNKTAAVLYILQIVFFVLLNLLLT